MKNSLKKRIVSISMVAAIGLLGIGTCKSVYANNCRDKDFAFDYNGDGSDLYTNLESKEDTSASYVFNNPAGQSAVISVAAGGSKSRSSYGHVCSEYYTVKQGYRKYMPNTIYQSGFRYGYLAMASADHRPHHLSGKWSPDNCSGY